MASEAGKKRKRDWNRAAAAAYHGRMTPEVKEQRKLYNRTYQRRRKASDPIFKLICNMRTRMWAALKGNVKSASTINLTGCTLSFLKMHLEKQFTKGMNWSNQGEWHVDHILPCCSFNMSKTSEQKKAFHYTNLQPLWRHDNLRKSGTI